MVKQFGLYSLLLIFIMGLSGCADVEIIDECQKGYQYNFWYGLWHGLIFPFSFLGSIFSDEIAVYALNNNGVWYDFGFFIGVGGLQSGILKSFNTKNNNSSQQAKEKEAAATIIEVDEVKEPFQHVPKNDGGGPLPPASASKKPKQDDDDDDDEYIDFLDVDPRLN